MLVAIDRYSKYPSVKTTNSTGGKSSTKFLRSYINIHGIPESIRTDQFSGFKGKTMRNFCAENNIEQKFCPVGDHRGCGLVERTIQTIKKRLGVMMLEENMLSIKFCLRQYFETSDGANKKLYNYHRLKFISDDFRKLNSKS